MSSADGTNLKDEKEADETVHEIALKMKSEIEAHLKMKFTFFKAISYRTQTVRGTNFFIKIKLAGVDAATVVDSNLPPANNQPIKFVHVRIWRDLPVNNHKLTLYPKIDIDKTESDPISYFE